MLRLLTLGAFVLVLLSSCKKAQETESKEIIRPVYTTQVLKQENFSIRKFPARAEAYDAVSLAFEVSGKLNRIPIKVGDIVKKGQVLASVDARDFQNKLEQAQAELKRSQAQYERMSKALKANAVSKQSVTDAEAAFESAKANVQICLKSLEDTKLVAPYDGTITAKFVKSYGNVQAKQAAIRMVDHSKIEMVADIPEDIISNAKLGMEINVQYNAFPKLILKAKINKISAEASEATRTYPVTLIMNQPKDFTILPGMAGKAWRNPDPEDTDLPSDLHGFEVPVSAILAEAHTNNSVWIVDQATNTVSRQAVTLGAVSPNGVLVQGLKGGEIIVTAGVNKIKEGQKVRIIQTQK